MRTKRTAVLLFLLATGCVSNFAQGIEKRDEVEVYRNQYIGFELTLPKGWLTPEETERDALLKAGLERLKSGNKRTDAALEYGAAREVQLITVSKRPIGAIGNAIFTMSTLKQASPSVTAKMVLEAGKSVFLANSAYKLVRNTDVASFGRKQFAFIDLDVQANGQVIHLRYLVTMIGDNTLAIAMGYADEEDLALMESALRTIQFRSK